MKRLALVCFLAAGLVAPPTGLPQRHESSFVVVPADLNQYGTLFGGKSLAEMDRAAGIAVRRFLADSKVTRDAVTVAIDNVKFHRAAKQHELIVVSSQVTKVGTKSVTVLVKVEREFDKKRELLVEGVFTFVAYDFKSRTAVAHGLTFP